jgi:SagB-type dehydrogenase family enzyme
MKQTLALLVFLAGFSLADAQEPKSISLSPPQTTIGKPLMQALQLRQSSREFADALVAPQDLSNLLWAADGINRKESGKRTAPSAMNWQEVDVYVVLREGTYLYIPKTNELELVAAGDLRGLAGVQGFVKEAPLNLVYVADFARAGKGNDEDKKIYTAADVGFIAQNVYLYCASQGLAAVVRASLDRPALATALKLRADQKIILAQTVGHPK